MNVMEDLPISGTALNWVDHLPETLPGAERLGAYLQAMPGDLLVDFPRVARFRVRQGRWIDVAVAEGSSRETAAYFARVTPFGALVHERGELPLHASAMRAPQGRRAADSRRFRGGEVDHGGGAGGAGLEGAERRSEPRHARRWPGAGLAGLSRAEVVGEELPAAGARTPARSRSHGWRWRSSTGTPRGRMRPEPVRGAGGADSRRGSVPGAGPFARRPRRCAP